MKTTVLIAALAGLGLLSGCANAGGGPPFLPRDSMKYTLAGTGKFVLLDRATYRSVTCTGLQERILPDGRVEVTANVKNRENRRIQVQINCVFEDSGGISTGDEAPFQTLILGENATEAVRFTAMNTAARTYTIQVRQVR